MGFPDNYVRSVRVPQGWEVTLFGGGSLEWRDDNPSVDLKADEPDLDTWNLQDDTSSIRICVPQPSGCLD